MKNNTIEPKKIVGKVNKRSSFKTSTKMEVTSEPAPVIKSPGNTSSLSERPGDYQVYPGE